MKNILMIIFCVLASMAMAQPSSDIGKDTTLANQLYQKSLQLKSCNEGQLPLIEQAIKLYEAHNMTAKVVEMKGWLAYNLFCQDEERLLKEANEAIALAKDKLGDDKHLATHFAYLALGAYDLYMDTEKAEKYLKLIIEHPNSSDITYFEAVPLLTYLYRTTMEEYKVNPYLENFEQRLKQNEIKVLNKYEVVLNEVKSIIFISTENYPKTLIYGKEALRLNVLHGKPFDVNYRYADNSIAYAMLGQKDKAIKSLELFIENSDTIGYQAINYYNFYGQVAMQYSDIGNQEKTLFYAEKAKNVILPFSEEYPDIVAQAYDNLAYYYIDLGRYELAKRSAKETFRYLFDAKSILTYVDILNALEEYDKISEYVQKGLEMCSNNFKPISIFDNPKISNITDLNTAKYLLGHKAYMFYQLSKKEKIKAEKINYLEQAKETINLLLKIEKIDFLSYKGYDMYFDCMLCGFEDDIIRYQSELYNVTKGIGDLRELFDYMEQYKGKQLLNYFTENPLPQTLSEQEYSLTQNINHYQQKIALSTADSLSFFEKKLFDENQKMEKFIDFIVKNHPEHANYFYNTDFASTNDVQSNLDERTAFISYVITDDYLITYVIDKDKQQSFQIEIDDDFYDNIIQFNALLQNPFLVQITKRNQFIKLSHQLYQQLMQPLEPYIQDKNRLIISPNSDLFYLPFETLLATNAEEPFHELDFLIKQFDITYQYSATTYERLQAQPKILDKSFVGFAPIFENGLTLDEQTRSLPFLVDSLYRSLDNNQLSSLPNTKIEVTTISNLLPTSTNNKILTGKAATKTAMLQAMNSDVQFLHIATHGLVNYENPNLSALACYNSSNYQGNFLFANEVQNAKIKADLVILSSCESGIGQQVHGEGLIALNRSFIIGGANNVIFSLWKVNDEYSSELMIDFYKSYLENESYTAALRQAKLKMLQDPISANPRYWAAFVLIGE